MSSDHFKQIFKQYLDFGKEKDELEIKFGTKNIEPITRVHFDNVIQFLKSKEFTPIIAGGEYRLTIQNEYRDHKTARTKISFIRTEISSLSNIRHYCQKNSLSHNLENIRFNYKSDKNIDSKRVDPVDYDDFNFRISFKEEKELQTTDARVRGALEEWNGSKKIFRFMKRFTFIHDDYPLKIDCSIVKTSNKRGRFMIPTHTIEESNVFRNPEKFEIEIELLPRAQLDSEDLNGLIQKARKVIRYILSGLQKTNFPVSISEKKKVLQSYLNLFTEGKIPENIRPSDFIGPSSISLELSNIIPIEPESTVSNIREPYTVTEKADGLRNLLYIHHDGKIYLINTNMEIQFTGCKSDNGTMYNSLLDGELVLHDKMGKFINNFLAFDIYFMKNDDLRSLPFTLIKAKASTKTRLKKMKELVKKLHLSSITGKDTPSMTISSKRFYTAKGDKNIFNKCKKILQAINDGLFQYHTDGLIFTPIHKGVGSDKIGENAANRKKTWRALLKWKPPEQNTVDFLVTTKKTTAGIDFIGNLFENGDNMTALTQIPQYKTLILRVGYDERKHGYLTPCKDIINDTLPRTDQSYRNPYKPVPFYPTNPSDPKASSTNVNIELDDYGNHYMLTENREETFEDNTIVEFKYDRERQEGWKWIPIRVRYDKTSEYRKGLKNYGNAYHVANSVWHSIHQPVTEYMLKTGKEIPDELDDDSVYYKHSGPTTTQALRNFHNLYIKRKLIFAAAKKGDTLLDLAVGKGGDMPKWIAARLSFVFGIDISKDNIENRHDGICARYLNYAKKKRSMPKALFIEGNSSLNIRNGDAAATESGKKILQALFGKGSKDPKQLGVGVYKQWGKGKKGFNIISCQFALHYFFENQEILQNFMRNISENCKLGGYFIGTCYDGNSIFEALEEKKQDESLMIIKDEKKIWDIEKKYSSDDFEDDLTSVGYAIDVYQESIHKVFREFLVNFTYLTQILENYGFNLVSHKDAAALGLPDGSDTFENMFTFMENEIRDGKLNKANVGKSLDMSAEEKRISFYNRYFIFKKTQEVDADKIYRMMVDKSREDEHDEEEESSSAEKQVTTKKRKRAKRLKRVININTIDDN